ncbi:MAG: hypothetical protein WCG79_11690, partial [Verrucomicrobiota bacterium]
MKKYLVLFLLLIVAINFVRADADPGQLYADAFILLHDGQAAEHTADWATAFQKYTTAVDILNNIRKATPDWNPHVVEYRLKDITDKLDAVRGKAPVPAPVATKPNAQVAPATTTAVNVEPTTPATPSASVRPELEQLRQEIGRLLTELADAKKPRVDQQLEKLKQDNKQLSEKLATNERDIAGLKDKLAAKPVESPELKKLRTELANAKTDTEKASTAQKAELAKLQQQTKDLTGQLDAAKKAAAVESPELKKLRTELANAKTDTEKA